MTFREEYRLERVAVVGRQEQLRQSMDGASLIVRAGQHFPQGMTKTSVPLTVKTGPPFLPTFGQPLIVLQVFGDHNSPSIKAGGLFGKPLKECPAVGQIDGFSILFADEHGTVCSDSIDIVFGEPHEEIVPKKLPNRWTGIVGTSVPPRRPSPFVVVKVRPTIF